MYYVETSETFNEVFDVIKKKTLDNYAIIKYVEHVGEYLEKYKEDGEDGDFNEVYPLVYNECTNEKSRLDYEGVIKESFTKYIALVLQKLDENIEDKINRGSVEIPKGEIEIKISFKDYTRPYDFDLVDSETKNYFVFKDKNHYKIFKLRYPKFGKYIK